MIKYETVFFEGINGGCFAAKSKEICSLTIEKLRIPHNRPIGPKIYYFNLLIPSDCSENGKKQ